MTALHRKLARDLLHLKAQTAAIALVVAAGVGLFLAATSTYHALRRSQAATYDRARLADVWANVVRAPAPLAERIARIPGVARVLPRIVADVTLDVPGLAEPAVARLVSLAPAGAAPLNDIALRRGRRPEPGRAREAVVSEPFAEANGLGPGDQVAAVINGRRTALEIVGVALSAEYVIEIGPGAIWPDDRRFGVFWMPQDELAAAFDMEGAFNEVALTLAPGASEQEVIRAVDRLLDPYGGLGAYGRDQQLSHRYLTDEIRGLRGSALIIPAIFLSVAAFLVNIVLSRVVGAQRAEIATLKAFGYSSVRVGAHYLTLALAVVGAGAAIGIPVGARLGRHMAEWYTEFYRFPVLIYGVDPGTTAAAVLVSVGAAVTGALGAVWRVVALPPAQAMQPEAPPTFRPTWLERLGLHRLVTPATRMILRSVERRPARAILTSAAMSLAVAVLVVGGSSADSVRYLVDLHFGVAERADVTVQLAQARGAAVARQALAELPGVRRVEPFRAVAATLRAGHRREEIAIQGLTPGGRLRRIIDRHGHALDVPPDGVVLTAWLADRLGVARGGEVVVQVREGARPTRTVRVVALVDELVGMSAYMDIEAAARLAGDPGTVSGAHLAVDPAQKGALYARLKATPGVAGVGVREAALAGFRDTFEESLRFMRVIEIIFAVIIAFGVVYNGARVALSERARELATLRVLGFSRREISVVLLGELAILAAPAILLGFVEGWGLLYWVAASMGNDVMRMPVVIGPSTYAFAVGVFLAAALVSALVVRRKLDHLDLVAVLKVRE